MSDVRWEGLEHQEIWDRVMSGGGQNAASEAEGAWIEVRIRLRILDQQLAEKTTGIPSGWVGAAADATRDGLTPLGEWAITAATGAADSVDALNGQQEQVLWLRYNLPRPEAPVSTESPFGPIDPGSDPWFLADWQAADARRAELHAQAVYVMNTYTGNSELLQGTLQPWSPPPMVTPEVTPISVASAGSGVSGLGGGPGTDLGSGTTGSGQVLRADTTAGGAGSASGLVAAGAGTAGSGAAAGPGGATGSGGGIGGGGIGGSGIGGGISGGIGPAAGGPGGAGGGVVAGGPNGTGVGAGGPNGSGVGAGGPNGSGVGAAPGGVVGRSTTRGGTVSGGPGSGGPGSSGLGSSGTGSSGGRGPSTAFRPIVPGVPERGPAPPSWRTDPTIVRTPASGPGGGAAWGGESGASRGVGSGSLGNGPPASTGSGGVRSWPEAGAPGRAGSAPVAGEAGHAGTRTNSGHPGMMPMGAGAGSGGERERRRPHYLIDDSGAFTDDRWVTDAVLTPENGPPS